MAARIADGNVNSFQIDKKPKVICMYVDKLFVCMKSAYIYGDLRSKWSAAVYTYLRNGTTAATFVCRAECCLPSGQVCWMGRLVGYLIRLTT